MPTGQYLHTLLTLYFTLFAAQIFICILFWLKHENGTVSADFQEDIWLQAISFLSLAMLGGSLLLRKKLIEGARLQGALPQKLAQYRSGNTTAWALMEGATLINAIFYFLSGSIEFLYVASAVIGLFATQIPTRAKIIQELDLNMEEQAKLDAPE
jgi:hypothetical protein